MTVQNFTALLINLDRDTTRLVHMQQQLAQANISFVRQAGLLGDARPDDLKFYVFETSGEPKTVMKRGELGCYASHLRALQHVAKGACTLIMEDDLDLAPDLIAIIAEAMEKMPADWDILRLSSPPRRAFVPAANLQDGRRLIRYSKIPNSAGAYLVTQAGAQKFLQHGVRGLTFDDDLRRPWFHGMKTFGMVPPPVKAGVLKSSIDAIEAGRFDKPVSSRMERLLRGDHFHMFRRLSYNIRDLGWAGWLFCCGTNLADMIAKPIFGRSLIYRAARCYPGVK
jgi:glycosyl transferase family 25